ncbi:MAG: IS1634 family transposase [Patescibacteria group bacterium]
MKQQKGIRRNAIHKRYVLEAHPIIQTYIEKLGVTEIIGAYIGKDQRAKLGCEKVLALMFHNVLTSPLPLYEIKDWLEPLDEEMLGLTSSEAAFIQDDRVGKALEDFYNGRHKDVFFRLALRAIKMFDLNCSQIHQDTTTVTLTGKYKDWIASESLTFGHNKDHRPDLKQLVLGMSVTADGAVPLVHQVYSGNKTDNRVHVENHQRLRKLLQRSDFIYVADCKLATESNLRKITMCGGRFVTVMPGTWDEDKKFKKQVLEGKMKWRHLLSRRNNRKPESKKDCYYLAQGQYSTSQGYCLLWIRSTQKAEQDAETRTRHIEQALEELRELQTKLNRYKLKTKEAIKIAVDTISKAHKSQKLIAVTIHKHKACSTKYNKRGRPAPNDRGRKIWSNYFSMSISINDDAIQEAILTEGIFPLITNIETDYTPKQILEIYKYQPFLEKRHSQLKTNQLISPVFLKKAERVVAILHVHVMALMIATLIERQLRIAMKRNAIESLPIYPEGKPCKYPTIYDVVRLFRGVERYEVEHSDKMIVFPAELNKIQKQVLGFLEVPISIYQ